MAAIALILLLLLLAYKATTEGLSNFYAQSAHQEIERWSRFPQAYRPDDWTRVMQYLGKSLDYSPASPWPLEERASLQLRSVGAARDAQLAVASVRSANADLRLALAQRPTSPFAWANFVLTKLYLDEQDDELFRALALAEELGPWEPEVQQSVVLAGLAVWDRLDPARQAGVLRAMQRGARRDPAKIAEIATSFSRIDLFCGLGYISKQGEEVCSKTSKSLSKPNRPQ